MKIFTIIVFGLAVLRTLQPFANDETYKRIPNFIASTILASTMCGAYIWFLKSVIN